MSRVLLILFSAVIASVGMLNKANADGQVASQMPVASKRAAPASKKSVLDQMLETAVVRERIVEVIERPSETPSVAAKDNSDSKFDRVDSESNARPGKRDEGYLAKVDEKIRNLQDQYIGRDAETLEQNTLSKLEALQKGLIAAAQNQQASLEFDQRELTREAKSLVKEASRDIKSAVDLGAAFAADNVELKKKDLSRVFPALIAASVVSKGYRIATNKYEMKFREEIVSRRRDGSGLQIAVAADAKDLGLKLDAVGNAVVTASYVKGEGAAASVRVSAADIDKRLNPKIDVAADAKIGASSITYNAVRVIGSEERRHAMTLAHGATLKNGTNISVGLNASRSYEAKDPSKPSRAIGGTLDVATTVSKRSHLFSSIALASSGRLAESNVQVATTVRDMKTGLQLSLAAGVDGQSHVQSASASLSGPVGPAGDLGTPRQRAQRKFASLRRDLDELIALKARLNRLSAEFKIDRNGPEARLLRVNIGKLRYRLARTLTELKSLPRGDARLGESELEKEASYEASLEKYDTQYVYTPPAAPRGAPFIEASAEAPGVDVR